MNLEDFLSHSRPVDDVVKESTYADLGLASSHAASGVTNADLLGIAVESGEESTIDFFAELLGQIGHEALSAEEKQQLLKRAEKETAKIQLLLSTTKDQQKKRSLQARLLLCNHLVLMITGLATSKSEKAGAKQSSMEELDEITKRSLEFFMAQAGIPKREDKPEYENVTVYLEAVHDAFLNRVAVAVLDGILDPSAKPRTISYKDNPMYGPGKEMDLLTLQLIYAAADWQSVKTFESFLDEFPKYFSDSEEKQVVEKYKRRTREQLVEFSVWHNRAYVRRQNQDATGPEGAFNALKIIFENKSGSGLSPAVKPLFLSKAEHPDLLESEIKFGGAIRFVMSFWSLRLMKKRDRVRLWGGVNSKLKTEFFNGEKDLKPEYDVIPTYRSTKPRQIALIEKLVQICIDDYGLSREQALLAYDVGEKFRIGAGYEAFFDASFGNSVAEEDDQLRPKNNVSVQAQEGEPKASNLGLYVDSAVKNTARPDFVQPFGEYMVHGYVPYSVAANYSYRGSDNITDLGDSRATLAELISVEGGPDRIMWDTGSTNPDKVVFQLANQSVNFLWPSARLDKATDPKFEFFIDYDRIPIAKSLLLDKEGEMIRISNLLGWYNPSRRVSLFRGVADTLSGRSSVELMEQLGFKAVSEPFDKDRTQRIKGLFKDVRDYWLQALTPDIQSRNGDHPLDSVRILRYLFSRDDGPNGYVNLKIGKKIESARGKSTVNGGWYMKQFFPWLQGYITYDLMMRSTYFLLQPDFRRVEQLREGISDQEIEKIYRGLSFSNFDIYNVQTIAGTPPLNRVQLAYLMNQSIMLLDVVPPDELGMSERDKMVEAGYKLFDDGEDGVLFDHQDLLYLAQQFGIGEGYVIGVEKEPDGKRFLVPIRDGEGPTRQYIVDRLTLCNWLFSRKKINH